MTLFIRVQMKDAPANFSDSYLRSPINCSIPEQLTSKLFRSLWMVYELKSILALLSIEAILWYTNSTRCVVCLVAIATCAISNAKYMYSRRCTPNRALFPNTNHSMQRYEKFNAIIAGFCADLMCHNIAMEIKIIIGKNSKCFLSSIFPTFVHAWQFKL